MTRPARVIINRQAVRNNLQRVRDHAPGKKIMAIIKADAYGHGLLRVARALEGADALGVACLEEARLLREGGITQSIVLLEGPFSTTELTDLRDLGVDTVVHHETQLAMLDRLPRGPRVRVWLKIDTGMHRLGFPPEEAAAAYRRLMACSQVDSPPRLMTHLACAHQPGDASVSRQLDCFEAVVGELEGERCIANSAGVLAWAATHADWVRPGLMLYGVSPLEGRCAADLGLQPAMTLTTELIAVRRVRAGEGVGYGATWRCPEDMPVGVAAIGYGDGYPRHAVSGTPVLLNGRRVALIGKASMDMLTLDLRTQPEARVGDPVTLWGEGLPVEEVARAADTIPYELLCAVRRRTRLTDHYEA